MYYNLCKTYNMSYAELKQNCDDYFYLPARQEHRGTGGIFFDDVEVTETSVNFCQQLTRTWMPSWLTIAKRRNKLPYTTHQKQWQKIRRGRYLEFNLLYDVRLNLFCSEIIFSYTLYSRREVSNLVCKPPIHVSKVSWCRLYQKWLLFTITALNPVVPKRNCWTFSRNLVRGLID